MTRGDGRENDQLRPVTFKRNYLAFAEGSVLITSGNTRVLCSATVENKVPPFLLGAGRGWITAEYAMLPRSTQKRIPRESRLGRVSGRTHEIQRLIGRSLRAVVDLTLLGERTVTIDCDVIQADGGTRTTAITGAYVALTDTLSTLIDSGAINKDPMLDTVAATSVGIVDGAVMLDLCYEEDATADVDMNFVMTGNGNIIEVQGTAELAPFSKEELDNLYALASGGIKELASLQQEALGKRK